MVTSQTGVQGRGELEQKLDKSYFIHTIPGQLPAKKVWFQHFPVLWHRSQSTFQKNFSTGFQVFVCFFFWCHACVFEKNELNFLMQNLLLNQLAPISNPKNEKAKSLYAHF